MQAIEHNGKRRIPEGYDPERLEGLLDDPKVKEVRVFRLKQGMTIDFGGQNYKVSRVRPNGKVTLRPVGKKAGV